MSHGYEAEFFGTGTLASQATGEPSRLQRLQAIAAEAQGRRRAGAAETEEARRTKVVHRALGRVQQWVTENTARLSGLLDSAAVECDPKPLLVTAEDIIRWLAAQDGLDALYLRMHDSTSRISAELVVLLRTALEVPVEKLGRLLIVEDALLDCLQHWPQRP